MTILFDPVRLGDLALANRIVMAPMTRSRAGPGDEPTALHVEYYRQRATAGLIVAEGTYPSKHGKGYCRTPGIHTAGQIRGWRTVTDAVHAEGGRIVLQLMHCGRIGSRLNKGPDAQTVAPSVIRARGRIFADGVGMVDFDEPRALSAAEVPNVIGEFRVATAKALAAGFDGVELHCASGYLPMQFLSTGTNRRTDRYGGPVENRIRFVVETIEGMSDEAGSGRVGLRICPGNPFNDLHDDDPGETYSALLRAVTPMRLAYLHLIWLPTPEIDSLAVVKTHYQGALILNESVEHDGAQRLIADGTTDAVSFGRPFIANPDLVRRFREGRRLADFDPQTLYTPGPAGYIDYPAL
ncbi:alkene reductase [Undibacterium arcticum]|uniref:Alkene reductase n=1 Tax=Undibacterium arcticum TaxID=1762892 RepID=A0ABV7EV25_9BURK